MTLFAYCIIALCAIAVLFVIALKKTESAEADEEKRVRRITLWGLLTAFLIVGALAFYLRSHEGSVPTTEENPYRNIGT